MSALRYLASMLRSPAAREFLRGYLEALSDDAPDAPCVLIDDEDTAPSYAHSVEAGDA